VIRGVVGDTIKVVFRNNLDRPAPVHVHGVFYDKSSGGAPYADGTSGAAKNDDGVAPGATYTYSCEVPGPQCRRHRGRGDRIRTGSHRRPLGFSWPN
jgi:FtsP/CotA-like multicopper oxidase with cupredoxin domain